MGRIRKGGFEYKTELLEYLPIILYLCPSKRHPLPPLTENVIYIYIYIHQKPLFLTLGGHLDLPWVGGGDFPAPPRKIQEKWVV